MNANLLGTTFGQLTVTRIVGEMVEVKCACHTTAIVSIKDLTGGVYTHCGCMRKEKPVYRTGPRKRHSSWSEKQKSRKSHLERM
jgi:hypothetical protein